MATLKEIRKRIDSVKNTQQITRAMYMVSAAKLRRAQDGAEHARPYAESMKSTIEGLVGKLTEKVHPLLLPHDETKVAELVVFTSDRGLCGGFNANLIKKAEAFIEENRDNYESFTVTAVGKKAGDYYRRRKRPARRIVTNLVREISYDMARELADELTERYISGESDVIYLVYPVFKSALTQNPTVVKLLPFEFEEGDEDADAGVDYIYEPSLEDILETLLPKEVRTQVYTAMLETVASEHGARMTAMDSASSNASDMIDSLTLQFNRARQASITKELSEIIGGAEALKG